MKKGRWEPFIYLIIIKTPLRSKPFLLVLLLTGIFLCTTSELNAQLVRVEKFGSDPGNLKMYLHTPPGINAKAKMPLVVVLHGLNPH